MSLKRSVSPNDGGGVDGRVNLSSKKIGPMPASSRRSTPDSSSMGEGPSGVDSKEEYAEVVSKERHLLGGVRGARERAANSAVGKTCSVSLAGIIVVGHGRDRFNGWSTPVRASKYEPPGVARATTGWASSLVWSSASWSPEPGSHWPSVTLHHSMSARTRLLAVSEPDDLR